MSERSEAAFIKEVQKAQVDGFYRRLAQSLNNLENGIDYDWKLPEGLEGEGFLIIMGDVDPSSIRLGGILTRDGEMFVAIRLGQGRRSKMSPSLKRDFMELAETEVAKKRDELRQKSAGN